MECDAMEGHEMEKFLGKVTPTWHHISKDTTLKDKINSAALNIKFV
jgi:hypothetical protein